MNTKEARKALDQVATDEGVSIETIMNEIDIAMGAARSNPNPEIQRLWNEIPCQGEHPTPEEVIAYITRKIRASTSN